MADCQHTGAAAAGRACPHMLTKPDSDYLRRFFGKGLGYDLVCTACAREPDNIDAGLRNVCSECFAGIERDGCWDGIVGSPEVYVAVRPGLRFQHEMIGLPGLVGLEVLDAQPAEGSPGAWIACTTTGSLIEVDPVRRTTRVLAQVPADAIDFDGPVICVSSPSWSHGPRVTLKVSRDGTLAAVANTYGRRGVVLDLSTGQVTMKLQRDDYHPDVSAFPLALAEAGGRTVVIHGTEWNRLDVSDARTGVLLTQRRPTAYKRGEERPTHYLDYFHCELSVSPDQRYMVDNGWVWHPDGVVTAWSLARWLEENVWESEDGPSKKQLCWRGYYWDGPLCWVDDRRLAVWGYGQDDDWLIPAVRLFDVPSGKEERWFPGPKGRLACDGDLFSWNELDGLAVWEVATGARLAAEPGLCPMGYHPGSKQFLSFPGDRTVRVSWLVQE